VASLPERDNSRPKTRSSRQNSRPTSSSSRVERPSSTQLKSRPGSTQIQQRISRMTPGQISVIFYVNSLFHAALCYFMLVLLLMLVQSFIANQFSLVSFLFLSLCLPVCYLFTITFCLNLAMLFASVKPIKYCPAFSPSGPRGIKVAIRSSGGLIQTFNTGFIVYTYLFVCCL
jgi:hypothetical protein